MGPRPSSGVQIGQPWRDEGPRVRKVGRLEGLDSRPAGRHPTCRQQRTWQRLPKRSAVACEDSLPDIIDSQRFRLVTGSVLDPQLMHAPVNSLDGFPEGAFEISEMVFLSVVVSDRFGGSVRGRVPHIF